MEALQYLRKFRDIPSTPHGVNFARNELLNFPTGIRREPRFQVHDLIDNYVTKLPSSQRTLGISNELRKPFVKRFVKRTAVNATVSQKKVNYGILPEKCR